MPAGLFSKLLGTLTSFFQVGGSAGPGLNANGAVLETKNAANTAFAIHRGATPAARYASTPGPRRSGNDDLPA